MPERIRNAPTLCTWLYDIYEAFFELLSCLTSEGRIPWTAIAQYAYIHSLASTPSELHSFTGLIRGMERAYSDHRRSEQDKADKAASKKKKGLKHGGA